jgi:hypothetical protein
MLGRGPLSRLARPEGREMGWAGALPASYITKRVYGSAKFSHEKRPG